MNIINHILLTTIISILIGGGIYWLDVWKHSNVMITKPKDFFGGVTGECFFVAITLIGIIIGILTK